MRHKARSRGIPTFLPLSRCNWKLRDNARTDGPAAFADCETVAFVESNRRTQRHAEADAFARQTHVGVTENLGHTCYVRRAEEELRAVTAEERRVPSSLLLTQNVNFCLESRSWNDASLRCQHVTAMDFIVTHSTQQTANAVTGSTFIEDTVVSFDAGANRAARFVRETNDLQVVAHPDNALLDRSCDNRTSAVDREHVLDRHEEWLVDVTFRIRNVHVECIQQFVDAPHVIRICRVVVSQHGRTTNERSCLAVETVSCEQLTRFHFDEFNQFDVFDPDKSGLFLRLAFCERRMNQSQSSLAIGSPPRGSHLLINTTMLGTPT